MNHSIRRIAWIAIAATLWAAAGASSTQGQCVEAGLDPYGQGINAYFDGRSSAADALLSCAIEEDASNPTAYYFRSLARLRLGHDCEARDDMQIGAALEAAHARNRMIGTMLERVQGCNRLLLERYRHESRANAAYIRESLGETEAVSVTSNIDSTPGQMISEGDAEVLRERIVVPLDELLRPDGPRAMAAGMAENWPDESARATRTAAPEAASETQASSAAESNPFDDDAAETPAATPSPPPAPAPAEQPATPPAAEDNPFESP